MLRRPRITRDPVAAAAPGPGRQPAAPRSQLTPLFYSQLAVVCDIAASVGQQLPAHAMAAMDTVREAVTGTDVFATSMADVVDALQTLQRRAPTSSPVVLMTDLVQGFLVDQRVVVLPNDQLFSVKSRTMLGTRLQCTLQVAKAQDAYPLLKGYLDERPDEAGRVAAACDAPEGKVAVESVAASLATAAADAVDAISRAVLLPRCPTDRPMYDDAFLALLQRFCCFGKHGATAPCIVVASGTAPGRHVFDFVMDTFVGLGAIAGAVAYMSVEDDLTPAQLADVWGCVQSGVPVVVRTAVGVPHALATHLQLRLEVAHVRGAAAAMTSDVWYSGFGREVWDAVMELPHNSDALWHCPQFRPAPNALSAAQQDVALLSEMLQSAHMAVSMTLKDVCDAYVGYRARRGYYGKAASASGITVDVVAAAAAAVNTDWASVMVAEISEGAMTSQ